MYLKLLGNNIIYYYYIPVTTINVASKIYKHLPLIGIVK